MLHKDFNLSNPHLDRLLNDIVRQLQFVPAYGMMYAKNIAKAVTIVTADVATEILSGLTLGKTNRMLAVGTYGLKATQPGTYMVTYHASIRTSGANDAIEIGLMVNHTEDVQDAASHTTVFSINKAGAVAGSTIVFLQTGDIMSLYVKNQTSTNSVTIEHMGMCVSQLEQEG